jgi:signal transduction histidine kinase
MIGYRGVDADITERKSAENLILKINEELEQKVKDRTIELTEANLKLNELNATKDKFFSIIAHDLKNPFNSILVQSQLLLMNYNMLDANKILKSIRHISNSAENAYNLLENLLEWSRSQTGKIHFNPVETSLDSLFKTALESTWSIAAHKKISIELEPVNDITLMADKNMLNTVLRNLITNAIKFTPTGGKIILNAVVKRENVIISVADTGVGMCQEIIHKLFKINSKVSMPGTDNEPGTGLGLILCKEFVEKHGGKIKVESEEGKGSVFSFNLPLTAKK